MSLAELAFTNSRNFLVNAWFGVRPAVKFILRCSSIHSNKNIGREKNDTELKEYNLLTLQF